MLTRVTFHFCSSFSHVSMETLLLCGFVPASQLVVSRDSREQRNPEQIG